MSDLKKFVEVNTRFALAGRNARAIARELQVSVQSVLNTRTMLRSRGIPLPPLKKGRKAEQIDVSKMVKLIADLEGKNPTTIRKRSRELIERNEHRQLQSV